MNFGIFIIELIPLALIIALFFVMKRMGYTHVGKKISTMTIAVLLFMIMSEPMYRNYGLDSWAYIYRDVPWTIVLGLASIFLISIIFVDKFWKKLPEKRKFWRYLAVSTIISVPVEGILLRTGLRGYSPILTDTFSGISTPLTQLPIEVVLAFPIIAALVIGFYKHFTED